MPAFTFEKISPPVRRGPIAPVEQKQRGVIVQMLDRLVEARARRAAGQDKHRRPLLRASAQAVCCLVFAFWMVVIAGHFDPGGPGPNPHHGMAKPFLAMAFASLIFAFGLLATGVASSVEQRNARRRAAAGLPPKSAGPR